MNPTWVTDATHLLFYLQEGGNVEITNISKDLINSCLNDGKIILACVEQSWLWGNRKLKGKVEFDDILGTQDGHFVVVTGIEDNNYIISDPYPLAESDQIKKVNQDQFIIATLIWNAQLLII